jgi:hypothetical protein
MLLENFRTEPDLGYADITASNPLTEYQELLEPTNSRDDGSQSAVPPDAMLDVFAYLKYTAIQVFAQSPTSNLRKTISYTARMKIKVYLQLLQNRHLSRSDRYSWSWLLASLIYLHTIEAFPDEVAYLPNTERQLIYQLKLMLKILVEAPECFGYPYRVLIWILLFGGLHAQGTEAVWFRSALDTTCANAQLSTWANVKALLIDMPWVQSDVEKKLNALCFGRRQQRIWDMPEKSDLGDVLIS